MTGERLMVVVDTNVWVSGLYFRGKPYRVLLAWRDHRFDIALTPETLAELAAVLREKNAQFGGDPAHVEEWLEYIRTYARLVPAAGQISGVCRDPDDDRLLDAAVSAHAAILVSGDADLLVLGSLHGVRMLSPADFLAVLEQVLSGHGE